VRTIRSNLSKLHTGSDESDLIDSVDKILEEYEEEKDFVPYPGTY